MYLLTIKFAFVNSAIKYCANYKRLFYEYLFFRIIDITTNLLFG